MAEGFLNTLLEEMDFPGRVYSAGLCTVDGLPASSLAIKAMREKGIDLSGHRSRQVNQSLIESSEHVVGVTASHGQALLAQFPAQSSRIRLFPILPDIPDPYGSDLETYRIVRDLLHGWSCSLLDCILERPHAGGWTGQPC